MFTYLFNRSIQISIKIISSQTDYRAIVGTEVSTRFRHLSRSRRPDDQVGHLRTSHGREKKSRRKEERKNNWKFSDGQIGNGRRYADRRRRLGWATRDKAKSLC